MKAAQQASRPSSGFSVKRCFLVVLTIFSFFAHLFFDFFKAFLAKIFVFLPPFLFRVKPNRFLNEGFGPVLSEVTAEELRVLSGQLPDDLEGEYVRNGPNPRFDIDDNAYYHWFDGDGMLHSVYISDGKASYRNRWVRTKRFKEEEKAGKRVYPRLPEISTRWFVVKVLFTKFLKLFGFGSDLLGQGTANTAVAYHDGRFLALVENDKPTQVKLPVLETIGQYDYDGKLDHSFTAHPKVDARTGELMFFGYSIDKKPYCKYSVVSQSGELLSTFPIHLDVPVMMHDFTITENYSIVMDLPFTFRPERIIKGELSAFKFEPERGSRFGIFPRHSASEEDNENIMWFHTDSCYIFHVLNSWEEGDEVILFACRSNATNAIAINGEKNQNWLDKRDYIPFLYCWRFNLKNGSCIGHLVTDKLALEFPQVDNDLIGYKTRYGYFGKIPETENPASLMNGVVKVDLDIVMDPDFDPDTAFTVYELPNGKGCGEWSFVKAEGGEEEDDGYLVGFVYDHLLNSSEFWVFDARDITLGPICRLESPQRIPFGFHGKWITPQQIQNQQF
eukprot:CAMPEP_0174260508 /NCGR_PEP_ID=MMETSP0439-20130205/9798_1 /TAXON_ID=0 /ORGANISM="Stereomyxa ramosa, Strain Chinc5" /LENGTH=559 /DNA_ID=CAMNT_0015344765 /DNA_START=23 /DNA_END=1702 /DNA_ORIENTATION=-